MTSLASKKSISSQQDLPCNGVEINLLKKNQKPSSSSTIPISKLKTEFKNSAEEWLVKKKNVPMTEDQELLDEFNCGYSGNIVVTGKIYITNKRLCFYSPFNDKNIFFQSTFIHIPKNHILKIQKKHNAKIFDNSIQITKTNLETIFFTSFVSRNKCYDLMVSYLLDPESEPSLNPQHSKSSYEDDVQFLTQKVKLLEFQYLIHSFSCGLAMKSNIMGRIFVTNKRIFFHSLYDERNGISKQTQINLMGEEILKIEKRYNTLIFDNSILVISKKGSFFFTSFLARDKVFHLLLDIFVYDNAPPKKVQDQEEFYDLDNQILDEQFGEGIQKMNETFKGDFIEHQNQMFSNLSMKNNKKSSIITYQEQIDDQKVNESEFMQTVQQNDDINSNEIDKRQKQIMGIINHQPNLQVIGEEYLKFPGLNALKGLRIFDSGQEFFINGHKYEDFMTFFKRDIMKRRSLKISKWKPNVLEYLNTSNIKQNCPLEFERDINQIVKIQKTGIPFMPSEANSKQVQKLFIISKDKYVIQSYVHNSGAPYSDTFHIVGRRIVETVTEGTIKITVSMETVFNKKPLLSSLIEAKCEEEGTKQQEKMFDAMKQYFKNLEQSKIKK